MDPIETAEYKAVVKDAIKEWMDAKLAEVKAAIGGWVIHAILVALVGALAYYVLAVNGWQPPRHVDALPGIH